MSSTEWTSTQDTIRILREHGIEIDLREDGLYARDHIVDRTGQDVSVWMPVSDMSTGNLYRWLGY
jgi:hypothetical protein